MLQSCQFSKIAAGLYFLCGHSDIHAATLRWLLGTCSSAVGVERNRGILILDTIAFVLGFVRSLMGPVSDDARQLRHVREHVAAHTSHDHRHLPHGRAKRRTGAVYTWSNAGSAAVHVPLPLPIERVGDFWRCSSNCGTLPASSAVAMLKALAMRRRGPRRRDGHAVADWSATRRPRAGPASSHAVASPSATQRLWLWSSCRTRAFWWHVRTPCSRHPRLAAAHTSHGYRHLPHGRANCRTGAYHLRSSAGSAAEHYSSSGAMVRKLCYSIRVVLEMNVCSLTPAVFASNFRFAITLSSREQVSRAFVASICFRFAIVLAGMLRTLCQVAARISNDCWHLPQGLAICRTGANHPRSNAGSAARHGSSSGAMVRKLSHGMREVLELYVFAPIREFMGSHSELAGPNGVVSSMHGSFAALFSCMGEYKGGCCMLSMVCMVAAHTSIDYRHLPHGRAKRRTGAVCLWSNAGSYRHLYLPAVGHPSHDYRHLPQGRAKCRTGAYHLKSNTQLSSGTGVLRCELIAAAAGFDYMVLSVIGVSWLLAPFRSNHHAGRRRRRRCEALRAGSGGASRAARPFELVLEVPRPLRGPASWLWRRQPSCDAMRAGSGGAAAAARPCELALEAPLLLRGPAGWLGRRQQRREALRAGSGSAAAAARPRELALKAPAEPRGPASWLWRRRRRCEAL